MEGVLCSGSIVLDILVRPVDEIVWNATTLVGPIGQHLGGNGANTAYALSRLGVKTRLLGMVGNDAAGEYAFRRLSEAGVDTGGIGRSVAPTACTVGLVKTKGDRSFLHHLGSNTEVYFTPEDLRAELAACGAAHYHMGSPFGLPRLRPLQAELLAAARAAGARTSLDTHWDPKGRWMEDLRAWLPHVDIMFMNQDEARMITGSSDPRQAAATLQAAGAREIVLKLAGEGCAVYSGATELLCPAFPVQAVDTTGAGDCFVAGFLAALERGCDRAAAARFACAVAALSIQKIGATEGVLSYEETLDWIAT